MIRLRGEGAPAHVMEFCRVPARGAPVPEDGFEIRAAQLWDWRRRALARVICLLKALNAIPARAEQRNNTVRTAEMTRTRDNGGSFPGFYLGFDASDPLCIPAVE